MKNKKERLQLIVNLIKKNCIGSQNELAEMLEKNGCKVTQATLSRDLKSMKITKVATNDGGYMYIIPDNNDLQDQLLMSGRIDSPLGTHGSDKDSQWLCSGPCL